MLTTLWTLQAFVVWLVPFFAPYFWYQPWLIAG